LGSRQQPTTAMTGSQERGFSLGREGHSNVARWNPPFLKPTETRLGWKNILAASNSKAPFLSGCFVWMSTLKGPRYRLIDQTEQSNECGCKQRPFAAISSAILMEWQNMRTVLLGALRRGFEPVRKPRDKV